MSNTNHPNGGSNGNGGHGSNGTNGGNGSGHDGMNGKDAAMMTAWAPSAEGRNDDDRGFDLAQIWGVLRDSRRTILIITAVIFTLVMAATMTARMSFTLRGSLYMGDL